MENTERFHEISTELYETVKGFLDNYLKYSTDAELAVNWETKEILIDSPSKFPKEYTTYRLADFIKINEQGLYEPILF